MKSTAGREKVTTNVLRPSICARLKMFFRRESQPRNSETMTGRTISAMRAALFICISSTP